MDGARMALALLSALAVVSSVVLGDPGRVLWYPTLIPGVPGYQELRRQTLMVPATVHVQWLRNGSHFRVGIVPESSRNGRCSHSPRGGMPPHSSQEERHPHSSRDEEPPHPSQGGHHYFSQDEQPPQYPQGGLNPHSSRDEQRPSYPQGELSPRSPQDGQHHYSPKDEQLPHHSHGEQRPHFPQDDQNPLGLLPSSEYDLTIEPPPLKGYDQLTTVLSVFDDTNYLLPIQRHDLSQLSIAAKEQLKGVGTLEEALQVPGFPQLLQEDQEEPAIWTLDDQGTHRSSRMHRRKGVGRMRRPALSSASSGDCEVERVSVRLEAPPGSRLLPSCVRLGKCGGCCAPGRICVPTRINTLTVTVLQLPSKLEELQLVKRKVEEAAECRCECHVSATDCDAATQDYDPLNCGCVCKSSLEEARALCEASPKHQWSQVRCACICANVRSRECSSGHSFYEDSCRCEPTREE